MLDISNKYSTLRTAVADATLTLSPATLQTIKDHKVPKGDPFEIARVAAVMAAKQTSAIIPYCHPIPLTFVGVDFKLGEKSIRVDVTVKAIASTGVEMEAMTAVSVAALTLYDMLKMLDESMCIESIRLVSKRGGKSDFREKPERPLRSAVLVMSDTVSAGRKSDSSGKMIVERLKKEGLEVVDYQIVPDDIDQIVAWLCKFADETKLDLVITTGGTGFSPRDKTPEAMSRVITQEAPGIAEAVRTYGQLRTPFSMFSRGKVGLRGQTLIVNLPGSQKSVAESLDLLFPALLHAFPMIWGQSGWENPTHKSET